MVWWYGVVVWCGGMVWWYGVVVWCGGGAWYIVCTKRRQNTNVIGKPFTNHLRMDLWMNNIIIINS